MLRDYAENCSWKSRHASNHFGVNPHSPFLLPSTMQFPLSFESLTELHLLGKRGKRGGIPAVVSEEWVLHQSGPQQAV